MICIDMRFRTEIKPLRSFPKLDPEKPLLFLGSCFAENIGNRLRTMLWGASVNPAGILFNPLSILRSLETAGIPSETRISIIEQTLVERDGLFYSLLTDTSVYGSTPDELCEKVNQAFETLKKDVTEAQAVIITLGTAYIYRWAQTGEVVANCHKLPEHLYLRERINIEECEEALTGIITVIRKMNPGADVIMTVSPVRHLRDGFEENSRSKATLLLAAGNLAEKKQIAYFPAFEIMMDDLRDYRFYGRDLAHPSDEAVEYIKDIFLDSAVSTESRKLLDEAEALARRAAHRPLNPDSDNAIRFMAETQKLKMEFAGKHPGMLHI